MSIWTAKPFYNIWLGNKATQDNFNSSIINYIVGDFVISTRKFEELFIYYESSQGYLCAKLRVE